MSLLKVTPTVLVNVCACGAENEVLVAETTLLMDSVTLPMCPHCNECVSSFIAQPYEDSWEELDEASIRRYVLAQHAHYFATHDAQSKLFDDQSTKAEIIDRMTAEGRYEFVDASLSELVNTVHPIKETVWKRFKETGKPTLKRMRKALSEPKNKKFKDSIRAFAGGKSLDRSESNLPKERPGRTEPDTSKLTPRGTYNRKAEE